MSQMFWFEEGAFVPSSNLSPSSDMIIIEVGDERWKLIPETVGIPKYSHQRTEERIRRERGSERWMLGYWFFHWKGARQT
jgi:hypothetical protein